MSFYTSSISLSFFFFFCSAPLSSTDFSVFSPSLRWLLLKLVTVPPHRLVITISFLPVPVLFRHVYCCGCVLFLLVWFCSVFQCESTLFSRRRYRFFAFPHSFGFPWFPSCCYYSPLSTFRFLYRVLPAPSRLLPVRGDLSRATNVLFAPAFVMVFSFFSKFRSFFPLG